MSQAKLFFMVSSTLELSPSQSHTLLLKSGMASGQFLAKIADIYDQLERKCYWLSGRHILILLHDHDVVDTNPFIDRIADAIGNDIISVKDAEMIQTLAHILQTGEQTGEFTRTDIIDILKLFCECAETFKGCGELLLVFCDTYTSRDGTIYKVATDIMTDGKVPYVILSRMCNILYSFGISYDVVTPSGMRTFWYAHNSYAML